MSKNSNENTQKLKGVGRKDRQMLKQKHRRELEEAKLQQQREEAKSQIEKLKQTGLVAAYEQWLRSICKNGLPQPANVYELAAQYILKFEKKHKLKMQKKEELQRQNKDLLQSSILYENVNDFGQKGSITTIENSKK